MELIGTRFPLSLSFRGSPVPARFLHLGLSRLCGGVVRAAAAAPLWREAFPRVRSLLCLQVDKQGKLRDKSWKGAQKMMNNPEKFLQTLKDFKQVIDEGRVPEVNFKAVEPLLALPHFNREAIQKKSTAAAGLAEWVVNIYQFYKVVDSVAPKRRALEEATQQLEEANAKLAVVQQLVAELEEKVRRWEPSEADVLGVCASPSPEGKTNVERAKKPKRFMRRENIHRHPQTQYPMVRTRVWLT
ncbi:putative dynein heavy chain [Toxoplasma gondii FOU]|uniref:Putative dynein heavy chain n=1 Tax=Toxoplasma gondii FOU TaxID=943167 RepID=A0A086JGG8_TOXGO|nr:putative dynein heavy chain [Toxoplasma gondii FOU]